MMYKRYFLGFIMVIITANSIMSQVDWRIGFEYFEIQPPFTTEDQHDTLLSRLQFATSSQGTMALNVNGAGWSSMQPTESSLVDFSVSDGWVERFGNYNAEFIFYLVPNAAWSYAENLDCIDGPGIDECAPDLAHEQDWVNYVSSVVERYDGDGVDDMPGLVKPVRYYVMSQEVYFGGGADGDQGEQEGNGFWDDNITNLLRLHKITYEAIEEVDGTGTIKLVGAGGWLFDLYADFPDYPEVEGEVVQERLSGDNLSGSIYSSGFDSLKVMLQGLADSTGGKKCDYLGWHPHFGWKQSDQSLKFIQQFAPGIPIFIDDMWSATSTSIDNIIFGLYDGYNQFLPALTTERDMPSNEVSSFLDLLNGLDNGNEVIVNWYNAKTARDAVKCFSIVFAGGAERICYSLSNDVDPSSILYSTSWPYRYTGICGRKEDNFPAKPALFTMKMLVNKLHHFTSVTEISDAIADPYTRIFKFERMDDVPCYVAWSETNENPEDPAIPNGPWVDLELGTNGARVTHVVQAPGQVEPIEETLSTNEGNFQVQLGFSPILIEPMNIDHVTIAEVPIPVFYPNPCSDVLHIGFVRQGGDDCTITIQSADGKRQIQAKYTSEINVENLSNGVYFLNILSERGNWNYKVIKN